MEKELVKPYMCLSMSSISDHLNDTQTYRELTQAQAERRVQTIDFIIKRFIDRYFPIIDKKIHPDRVYLERMLKKTKAEASKRKTIPISVFYLLAKIHKQPLSTCPIVSVSGSTLFGLGNGSTCTYKTWFDFILLTSHFISKVLQI